MGNHYDPLDDETDAEWLARLKIRDKGRDTVTIAQPELRISGSGGGTITIPAHLYDSGILSAPMSPGTFKSNVGIKDESVVAPSSRGTYPEGKSVASRDNAGKPKLSYCLLGRKLVENKARIWEHGASKYSRGNWLKGRPWTDCADSLLRHLTAFLNGEDIDPDSGLEHVDLIGTSADILINAVHTRPDLDDRAVYKEADNHD